MLHLVMWSTSLTHLHMLSFSHCAENWTWTLQVLEKRSVAELHLKPRPSYFLILQFPLWKKEDWTLSPCTCSSANHPLIPIIANSLFESQNCTKLIVQLKVQGSWWALDLERPSFVPFPPLAARVPSLVSVTEKEDTGMSNAPISIMYSLCTQPESSAHLCPFIII